MERIHTYLIMVYGALLLLGSTLFVFDIPHSQWLFAAGALLAIVQTFVYAMQHKDDTTGDTRSDIQQARLHRLNFVASLFLGISAWMMFLDDNAWVSILLIYVTMTLYISFRSR